MDNSTTGVFSHFSSKNCRARNVRCMTFSRISNFHHFAICTVIFVELVCLMAGYLKAINRGAYNMKCSRAYNFHDYFKIVNIAKIIWYMLSKISHFTVSSAKNV